jgi:LacI family transcriptional regulator, galactose operon repressor
MALNDSRNARNGRRPSTTIREVAEKAGVSVATVSRVFSGGARVTDDVALRVREAARLLSYKPSRVARNLRVRQTRTVGVIVPDIENPFFTSVIGGIEEVLQASDYSLLLANSCENPKREQTNVRNFQSEGVAGVIFTPSGSDISIYRELQAEGTPLVAISRVTDLPEIDTVSVANRAGARKAVTHLLDLGHRRVAIISGPPWISTAKERLAGYEEALATKGLHLERELAKFADFRQHGGYEAMRELLDLPQLPTAVFVGSNLMTLGALQAIHERKILIPRDLAVVGFDDMPWAISLNPPLTAVAQPAYEVGVAAARLLIDRLRHEASPARHLVLETSLIVRSSCGSRLV